MTKYLVFREGSWAWRFRDGNVPGQVREWPGMHEWEPSICNPGSFFVMGEDGKTVLEPGITVGIEDMP